MAEKTEEQTAEKVKEQTAEKAVGKIEEKEETAEEKGLTEPKVHIEKSVEETKASMERARDRRIARGCGGCAIIFILFLIFGGFYFYRIFGDFGVSSDLSTPAPTSSSLSDSQSQNNTSTQTFTEPQKCTQVNTPDAVSLIITPADPGLKEDTDTYYYSIYGSTYNQLVEQINQCGPKIKGGSWAGLTNWNIGWTYDYVPGVNTCGIKNVTAGIKIDFYYPTWQKPAKFASGLDVTWQTYMDGLINHEEGHKKIGVNGTNRIINALSNLGEAATCEEIGAAANSTGQQILTEVKT